MVGVEGGVWVGIDRYDNDGVARYTVLSYLPYEGQGGTPRRYSVQGVLLLGTIRIIRY